MAELPMKKLDRNGVRRILILKWSAMGDVVISTAFFEDIRRAFPHAAIDLNVGKPFAGLFAGDPRFDRVLTADFKGRDRTFSGLLAWVKRMKGAGYDLVFDLQSNDRSRLLLSLLRLASFPGPTIVGLHDRFPYHLAPAGDVPAGVVRQQKALEAAGVGLVTSRPKLYVPEENRRRAADLLAANGLTPGRYGVFLPGCQAGGELKRWGWARYAALAELLQRNGFGRTVLIGGPDDLEECARVAAAVADPDCLVNLCGQTAILDVLPLVEQSRYVIGNDTGTAHIASCTDRPIIVICGPTDPRRVKPVGDNVVALQADLSCVNCYRKECDTHACMEMITPAVVHDRLATLCTPQSPDDRRCDDE
jgi:heptosyltransferase-2